MVLQHTYMCHAVGDGSFAVAGPCTFNMLPASLHLVEDYVALNVFWKHTCLIEAAVLSDFCFF